MKLRLFVAINLPEKEKMRISQELNSVAGLFDFPTKFLDPENWHLTISFLGSQDQEQLTSILDSVQEIASNTNSFNIEFDNISYGPLRGSGAQESARMIWLNGTSAVSNYIDKQKFDLEEKLVENNVVFKRDNRPYQAHITLSRFEARKISQLPKLNKKFNLNFEADSLDLMQSHLSRFGAKYETLAKFEFKD